RTPGVRLGPMRLMDSTNEDRVLDLDVPAVLTANHTDTLLRATLEGGGISSQPIDLLAPSLHSGHLQRVLTPWITARLTLIAVVPSRKFMPARTRAFMDYLVEHSRKMVAGLGVDLPQPLVQPAGWAMANWRRLDGRGAGPCVMPGNARTRRRSCSPHRRHRCAG
ncbi:MAG: transcriptional regulator, LysR family, partial [Ramlibacter sp.]|nr:transcriptional regulator, LysR family [Ramlibacter sp.]